MLSIRPFDEDPNPDELNPVADTPDEPTPIATKPLPASVSRAMSPKPLKTQLNPAYGDASQYSGDVAEWFAPEVKAATAEKVRQAEAQDVLDRFTATQAAREQAAQAKQAKRNAESTKEADFRTRGVNFYTNANGEIAPVKDEQGNTTFTPKKGEVQYDPQTGDAFRMDRTEKGTKTRAELDADAKIGTHPSDSGNLYRQDKNSPWNAVGSVEEGLQSADPNVKAAAEAAKAKNERAQHNAAKMGFAQQVNQVSAEERDHGMKTAEVMKQNETIAQQIAAIQADPNFGKTEGGWFGTQVQAKPTMAALDLQGRLDALMQQQAALGAPDEHTLKAAKSDFAERRRQARVGGEAFDASVAQLGGIEPAAIARRQEIEAQGGNPDEDPVLKSIDTQREKMGLPKLAANAELKKQQQENELRQHPVFGPIMQEQDALKSELDRRRADFSAKAQAQEAELAPLRQRLDEGQAQMQEQQAQAETLRKQLDAIVPGDGELSDRLSTMTPAQFAQAQPLLAQLGPAETQVRQLSLTLTPVADELQAKARANQQETIAAEAQANEEMKGRFAAVQQKFSEAQTAERTAKLPEAARAAVNLSAQVAKMPAGKERDEAQKVLDQIGQNFAGDDFEEAKAAAGERVKLAEEIASVDSSAMQEAKSYEGGKRGIAMAGSFSLAPGGTGYGGRMSPEDRLDAEHQKNAALIKQQREDLLAKVPPAERADFEKQVQSVRIERALDSAKEKLGAGDRLKELAKNPDQLAPFLHSIPEISAVTDIFMAAHRIQDAQKSGQSYPGAADDEEKVALYMAKAGQDKTFWYKFWDTLAAQPAFWGELASTGGLYNAGKAVAMKAGLKYLTALAETGGKDAAGKLIKASLLKRAGAFAGKSMASLVGSAAQTPVAAAGRIAEEMVQNMAPKITFSPDDEGRLKAIASDGDGAFMGGLKALGDQYVEVFTEHSGKAFEPVADAAKKLLGKAGAAALSAIPAGARAKVAKLAVMNEWLKAHSGAKLGDFTKAIQKGGWNGVLEEMFEERVGDVTRIGAETAKRVFNGEKFGSAIAAAFKEYAPDSEQLGVEAASFGLTGVAAGVSNTMASKRQMDDIHGEQRAAIQKNAQVHSTLTPDVAAAVFSTVPTDSAKALGAVDTSGLKVHLTEVDDRIAALHGQLDETQAKPAGIVARAVGADREARNAVSEDLLAAYDERAQLIRTAAKNRAVADAAEEIDKLPAHEKMAGQDPAAVGMTQDTARGLVKIAQGQPMDALTSQEQAAINAPTPDGLPRVEMVAGQPVITQGAIDRLREVSPASAALIGQSEADRRQAILQTDTEGTAPTAGGKQSQQRQSGKGKQQSSSSQPATEGGGTPNVEEKTSTQKGQQGQGQQRLLDESGALRRLSDEENRRALLLARVLRSEGVSEETAARYAHGYVSDNGMGEFRTQREDVKTSFLSAGGATRQSLPADADREAHNASFHASLLDQDRAALQGKLDEYTDQVTDDAVKRLASQGVKFKDAAKAKVMIREVTKVLAPHLAKYAKAFDTIDWQLGELGGGGASSEGPANVTFWIGDLIAKGGNQLQRLARNPKAGEKIIQEEAIHAIVQMLIPAEQMADLWRSLPANLQEHVNKTYLDDGRDAPDANMGHEFIRMVVQGRLDKEITEQTDEGLLKKIGAIFKLLLDYLGNLSERLRGDGASEETIKLIEDLADETEKRLRKILSDAEASNSYVEANAIAKNGLRRTGNSANGSASGSAVDQKGGRGSAATVPAAGKSSASKGGSGAVGNPADSAETRAELARLQAQEQSRKAQEERAKERRAQAVLVVSNRLADFGQVLAQVPADAQEQAKELLNRAVPGEPTYVLGSNRIRLPAGYIALAPGVVQTSHLPGQNFDVNPAYGGENTRDYKGDAEEQTKVRGIATPGAIDEGSAVTDAKSAADGPPQIVLTITDQGGKPQVRFQTAGGNGREMGFNLAPLEDQERLAEEWQRRASSFGFANLPDQFRGYRFLGVYDLRQKAQAAAYQELVDKLNPSQGVVQDAGARARIDAEQKVPTDRLVKLSLSLSQEQAMDEVRNLVRDAENLGLDRNLMNAVMKDGPSAQSYMQNLILHAAFRSPALTSFYFDKASATGFATVRGLIEAASNAAMQLRDKGQDAIADALATTLSTVADYVKNGDKIDRAISKAADQLEMGEAGQMVNTVAKALADKVELYPPNKRGIRSVDQETTVEGFQQLLSDIARAVEVFHPEADIFGTKDTISDTINRALDAHARRFKEYAPSGPGARAPGEILPVANRLEAERKWGEGKKMFAFDELEEGPTPITTWEMLHSYSPEQIGYSEPELSLSSRRPSTYSNRMRELMRKQREEGLNQFETDELTRLEKREGQNFMGFFDELRTPTAFELQSDRAPAFPSGVPKTAQLSLLSRQADDLKLEGEELHERMVKLYEARKARFAELKPAFDAKLREAAAAMPDASPVTAPLKGAKRGVEKMGDKWANLKEKAKASDKVMESLDLESMPTKLWDILRGSIVVDTIEQRVPLLRKLVELFGQENLQIEDRFQNPTPAGYSDIQINVHFGGDMYGELQIHIPEMLAAKEGDEVKKMADLPQRYWPENLGIEGLDPAFPGHKYYEEARTPSTPAERKEELNRQMAALYNAAKAAYERRTASKKSLSLSSRTQASSSEGTGPDLATLPRGPTKNAFPSSTTTGNPSSSRKNLAPGANESGAGITSLSTFGAGNGQRITVGNIQDYAGNVDVSELAKSRAVFGAFAPAEGAKIVPLSSLVSYKNELEDKKFLAGLKPDPRQTAATWLVKAINNEPGAKKRAPLDVWESGPGEYTITDGNATAQALMLAGWDRVPVVVHAKGSGPGARRKFEDTGTFDLFATKPLTPAAGERKTETKPNENSPKPRPNDAPALWRDGDLFLAPIQADSVRPGAAEDVDQGNDITSGGTGTGRGTGGIQPLDGSDGGGTGDDQGGISGTVGQGGSGNASNEPRRVERPPVGSPDRNAEIDGTRSYAPRQGKERFAANLDAIHLMRRLDEEGRNPTTEEKQTLLSYTGWGWMKEAFNKVRAAQWDQFQESLKRQYEDIKRYREQWQTRNSYSRYGNANPYPDPGTLEQYIAAKTSDASGLTEDQQKLASWSKNYQAYYNQLREELTPDEFDSAAKSVRNAHFTDVPYIAAMWRLVEHLGFKGGKATEPGAGIGHFIGAQPGHLADKTVWNAVELDDVTARILGYLYPEVTVNGERSAPGRKIEGLGFQEARIPAGSQDLVISNVPFAKEGPAQSSKEFGTQFNLHNYFFARAFAKARAGGLVVFITSQSTMDNNLEQRQALARMGELVGAIRLPNTAFKANAGTEVTTDIIVFRKPDGTRPAGFTPKNWLFTTKLNEVSMTVRRPEGKSLIDWLNAQPSEWVPQDPQVAEAFTEWDKAHRPRSGKRVEALRNAIVDAGNSDSITYTAPVTANEYFAEHPDHALGEHSLAGSMYQADSYALTPKAGQDTVQELDKVIQTFPKDIAGSSSGDTTEEPDRLTAGRNDKMGAYVNRDGKVYQVEPDGLTVPDWTKDDITPEDDQKARTRKTNAAAKRLAMFKSWSRIRDAFNTLIDLELNRGSNEDVDAARRMLNQAYDAHRSAYAPLAQALRNPLNFLDEDPDFIPLQSLEDVVEDVDPKTSQKVLHYEKAAVFTKRQIPDYEAPTKADTIQDAVLFSMSKNGFLHLPHVAELLNVSEASAENQLKDAKLAFTDPSSGLLEIADSYLSGNVGKKLDAAIEAAKEDPRFRPNVEALTAVQPPWESIGNVHPNPRANWVPAEAVKSFAENGLGLTDVFVNKAANMTVFRGRPGGNTDAQFEGGGMSAADLLDDIIGGKPTKVTKSVKDAQGNYQRVLDADATATANAAREAIERAFDEYTKTTTDKVSIDEKEMLVPEAVEQSFNKHVGGWLPPTFNGDWITLPGQSGEIYLDRGFRKAVLARLLTLGYGMIAHGVGSGKTLTQVALVMELRRLGKAKKPVIVVEKSTIGQFSASFRRAYPQAKILVAGEKNFGAQERARFLGKMQAGDWDAIIMTRPQVTKIPHDPAALNNFIAGKLAELDAALVATNDAKSQNNIQAMRDKLQEMIQKMADKLAENQDLTGVTWERLGVDALIVDEAHNFKNTYVYTTKENVKNLPGANFSQQAVSMELKTSAVRQRGNGKGIYFATGTPVSNAMHEAWVMLNYIAPHVLEENGVGTFDQFADTYGQTVTGPEATWKGEVKDVTRFAKFIHGQSLISMIRSVFDVAMGNEKLGLDVPKIKGGKAKLNILDETPPMARVNDWIVNTVAEQWNATFGEKDDDGRVIRPSMPGLRDYIEDNPWVTAVPIMTMQAGIAAALDPRMLHDKAEDHPGSKVNTVVRMVLERYRNHDNASKKTAQVIFTDLRNSFKTDRLEDFTGSNPFDDLGANARSFDLYEDVAAKLVAGGMKREEIGWLEQGVSDAKKEEFFDRVNSGQVRVVIGGEGISTGVNIQERLGTAYHLMPPRNFKPAQMEQRNGRIIRQGNLWAEWGHNAYVEAVEKKAGQKFEGDRPSKRRKAAEAWLEKNDKDGSIRKEADAAAAPYAIEIHELAMAKSLDSAIYSMMAAKQGFVAQVLSGAAGSEFEDPTDEIQLSMAQMAAETIGDPLLIRKIELERVVKKIKQARTAWVSKRAELDRTVRSLSSGMAAQRRNAKGWADFAERVKDVFSRRKNEKGDSIAPFYEFGDGTTFDGAEKKKKKEGEEKEEGGVTAALNRYLMAIWANNRKGNTNVANGTMKVNGMPVEIQVDEPMQANEEGMAGRVSFEGESQWSFRGAKSLLMALRKSEQNAPGFAESSLAQLEMDERRLSKSTQALESYPPRFEQEDEFQKLTTELDRIKGRLTAQRASQVAARIAAQQPAPAPAVRREATPEEMAMENEGGLSLGARRLADTGTMELNFEDAETPNQRVVKNLQLAYRLAETFRNIPGLDIDDIRSKARLGLMRASREFNPAGGASFATFANRVIRNQLKDTFRTQARYTSRFGESLDLPANEEEDGSRANQVPDHTASVSNDVAIRETKALINQLIGDLPDHLSTVVRGIIEGKTYEEIGSTLGAGMTKQAVGNRAQIAFTKMRNKLEARGIRSPSDLGPGARAASTEDLSGLRDQLGRIVLAARRYSGGGEVSPDQAIADLTDIARSETSGRRTVGRPDLALGTLNELVMAVDEWRKTWAKPQTQDDWQKDAEKMLAADYEGTKARLVAATLSGDQLTATQTKAAMMIVAREIRRVGDAPGNIGLRNDVHLLVNAYRSARAEQARGLAAGRDPFKTPEERHREFLAKVIYTPPEKVREKLDAATTPEDREKILTEDRKRIDKIEKELAKMGITFADLFSGEVELRIKAQKIAESTVGAFKGAEAEAVKAIMAGDTFAAISKRTGFGEQKLKNLKQKAIAELRAKHFAKFKAGATADAISGPSARAAVSDAQAEAEFAKLLEAVGIVPDDRQGKKPAKKKFNVGNPVHVVRAARTIQAVQANVFDKLYELWINNILSGPATHFANVAGNFANAAWDSTVQRGMESLLNLAFGSEKGAQFGEFGPMIAAVIPGLARGLRLAGQAWSAEYDFFEHDALNEPLKLTSGGKLDTRAAIGGTLGRVVRIPGRALLFADSFFKGALGTMNAAAFAYRMAKAQGLKGTALETRVKDLVNTPGSPAWIAAVEKAKEITFQQDIKGAEEGGNAIENLVAVMQSARGKSKLLSYLVPFIRTPFNIFRTGLRKTPLGSISLAYDLGGAALARIKDGKPFSDSINTPDQLRDITEQLIAWAAMVLLWGAMQGDPDDDKKQILITGSSPFRETTRGERELQSRAYGGAFMIRVGGRNGAEFNYGRYEPFATIIGTMADSIRALKLKGPAADKLDALFGYFVAETQSKTFLQGISDFMEAIQNASGIGQKMQRAVATAIVPNLIRQPLRNLDQYVRDTKAGGLTYAALPTAGNAPQRLDVYGKPVVKDGNPLSRLFLGTGLKPYAALTDADKLLLRWNTENPSAKWAPQSPERTYRRAGKDVEMKGDEYNRYTDLVGRKVSQKLSGRIRPAMIQAPKEDDVKMIRGAFESARSEARAQLFPEISAGNKLRSMMWK